LQEAGHTERSVAILQELHRRIPDNLDTTHYLAMGLAHLGEVAVAEEMFREALRRDDSFIEARGNLGWMLLEQRRNNEALEQFNVALGQYARHAASLHGRGLIFERLGRLDEALANYQNALESEPQRHAARLQLAILYTRMDRFREAIPLLERFINEAPENTFSDELARARRLLERLRQHTS